MKFKKIMPAICLMLAILAIGAVGASQDLNDTLTVEDAQQEIVDFPVEEITENDDVLSYETNDSVVESDEPVTPADFFIQYDNNITNLDDDFIWMDDCPIDGEITFLVNDSTFNAPIERGDSFVLSALDLEITDGGTYHVAVKFKPVGEDEFTLKEFDFHYETESDTDSFIVIKDVVDLTAYGSLIAYVKDKNSIFGDVTLSIDGRTLYSKRFNGESNVVYIFEDDLTGYMSLHEDLKGNRIVNVTYNDFSKESLVSFEYVPILIKPDAVACGETSYIIFEADDEFTGNVSLYNAVYDNIDNVYIPDSLITNCMINASAGEVPLPALTEGYHVFYVNYTIDGKNYAKFFRVHVRENSQNFTSTISSTAITVGNSLTVTVTGCETGGIEFKVDGKDYQAKYFVNGIAKCIFSGLTVGTHVISLSYNSLGSNDLFYSKSFLVNVSEKQKTIVVNNAVDTSNGIVYAELILTDIATGQIFKRNITVGPVNSIYNNPVGVAKNTTADVIKQLLAIAQIQAGDKTVTVINPVDLDELDNREFYKYIYSYDNRTYTWKDSPSGRILEVGGVYGTDWELNVTIIAEYASETINIADVKAALSKNTFTYNGNVQKPTVTLTNGRVLKEGVDYTIQWSNPSSKNAGTYTLTIIGKGAYAGTAKATYKITKASNPLKVKGKTVKVKFKKLKKKAQKLKVTKVVKFTKKGQGTLTYKKVKGNKKITISKKNGKVTIKKGLKKGTYKVKVKIKAKGNTNYKASAFKTITFKIKVK